MRENCETNTLALFKIQVKEKKGSIKCGPATFFCRESISVYITCTARTEMEIQKNRSFLKIQRICEKNRLKKSK